MASTGAEALTLAGDEPLPTVRVRASAVFSILSSYVRRSEKQARVIGTLVGMVKDGNVVEVIYVSSTTITLFSIESSHLSLFIILLKLIPMPVTFYLLVDLFTFLIDLSYPSIYL